jgi:alpha-galactosidase
MSVQRLAPLIPKFRDPLLGRTSGALVAGEDLNVAGANILRSKAPGKRFLVSVHPLVGQTPSVADWVAQARQQAAANGKIPLDQAWAQHRAWWQVFRQWSEIVVSGPPEAELVGQGYNLQRFMAACAGRGRYPIQYGGSIFTVDGTKETAGNRGGLGIPDVYDADFRMWGRAYWFQNTRLLYWHALMAGDFDIMQPLFRMYRDALPLAEERTGLYFHHAGAFFPETMMFWGTYLNEDDADNKPGMQAAPLATAQAGVKKLQPGDTLLIRGRVYREPRMARAIGALPVAMLAFAIAPATGLAANAQETFRASRPDSGFAVAAEFPALLKRRGDFLARPAFSFLYDGEDSSGLLATWRRCRESRQLDARRTEHMLTWTDPGTGLIVRQVGVEYHDYPAIEWTVYVKNAGSAETPILKDIQALNVLFDRGGSAGEFVLNGIKGDWTVAESYEPYRITLGPGASKSFAPSNHLGKSTSGPDGWPYFNLQVPGGGVLLAVGWPGQWACSFTRDTGNALRVVAGQELTRLRLKPGEQIRTPLIAMLFWEGTDFVPPQNLWRRWFTAHNMPRVGGQTQQPVLQIQVEASQEGIATVKAFLQAGIKPDICWRDAGAGGTTWYPSSDGPFQGQLAWLNTGTWQIDPHRFPNRMRPFSDWIHSQGMQFLLWFEPERVGDPGSWLGRNHPEWVIPCNEQGALLNEGDPAALKWLIEHIDGMIKSEGIDWYREDMNGVGPLPGWRKNDAADRQGITENFYVQGHLALWDELRRRNPGLRIDSCASGGRRNDLETMRRAVPLTRSDFQFPDMKGVVEGQQGHTYGLSFWLPFYGSGCYLYDKYSYRSFYMPLFGMGGLSAENAAAQKTAYDECRKIAPYMLGDYYPLTPYSLQLDRWIAWQFYRPEQGDGVVQAFRRARNDEPTQTLRLRGLDPAASYKITNFDEKVPTTATGADLMETGLTVHLPAKPAAAVVVYQKAAD